MNNEEVLEVLRHWAKQEVAEGEPQVKIRIESLTDYGLIKGMEDDDGDVIEASWKLRFEMDTPEPFVEFHQGLPREELACFLRKALAMVEGPKGEEIVNLRSTKHGPDHAARLSSEEVYLYNYNAEMDRIGAELAAAKTGSADAAEQCVPAAT